MSDDLVKNIKNSVNRQFGTYCPYCDVQLSAMEEENSAIAPVCWDCFSRMSDSHNDVMDACRAILQRIPISKCELAQELRLCADIIEMEMLRTDPPLAKVE